MVDERIKKHRTLIILFALFFMGVADEVRAWHKHNMGEAIAVAIIFFVLVPLLSIGFRKLIGTLDD